MALAALILSGAMSLAQAGTCEQRSPTVFVIMGEIDTALADCVTAKHAPTTRELIIDSPGGKVGPAMDIADRLSTSTDLTIRITGQCVSSCANYILPMARRMIAAPNAIIALHGGVDPAQVAKAPPAKAEALRSLSDKQRRFATRHGVPPGWLLYRTAEAPARTDGLDGRYRWPPANATLYLVEAPMLKSCLPWLDIGDYQAELEANRLLAKGIERLKRDGLVATGSIVCNGATW
ncbi:ATP-dependent Clp protease proteolytic subunit [Caulobacter segnis]|uniref:ATP-dependent Clp protease proteolytic subunit n=1 Tax=Caulobacter segnis TaxID=88688 RepID=UPI001D13123B|nr:ATP-dependent Clp protease proteolytic subunit [Caulobacter segnis]